MNYAALWSRGRAVYAGKAVLEGRSLLLAGLDRRGREGTERLALDDVAAVRVSRETHERLEGRPVLVLTMSRGPSLRLACLDGAGSLLELAERLSHVQATPA